MIVKKKELPAWKHFMTPVCAEFAHALMRHAYPLMTAAEAALGPSPQDDASSSGSDSEPELSTRTPLKPPGGFSMAPTMTEDDDLTFHIMRKNPWADWLVGQYILYKWPYYGWVVGRVVRRYLSREVEISPRTFANFQVYYDVDEQCADHNLSLDTYNIDESEEAPYHTWVRIIQDPDPPGWNEAISRAVSQVYEPDPAEDM